MEDIEPVICITKSDLMDDLTSFHQEMEWYIKAGYQVIYTHPGSDDEDLKHVLENKISVLCGQSGAGKSSLLNRLDPTFALQTQEISKALGRGKHTTRHCELHAVADGWVVDTPGFSSLDFARLDITNLPYCIKDFQPYLGHCRFKDCIHVNEPDCAIKEAMENKEINPTIYEDFVDVMKGNV